MFLTCWTFSIGTKRLSQLYNSVAAVCFATYNSDCIILMGGFENDLEIPNMLKLKGMPLAGFNLIDRV